MIEVLERLPTGGRRAQVVVSREKPFVFNYNNSNNSLNCNFFYRVVNRCGVVL